MWSWNCDNLARLAQRILMADETATSSTVSSPSCSLLIGHPFRSRKHNPDVTSEWCNNGNCLSIFPETCWMVVSGLQKMNPSGMSGEPSNKIPNRGGWYLMRIFTVPSDVTMSDTFTVSSKFSLISQPLAVRKTYGLLLINGYTDPRKSAKVWARVEEDMYTVPMMSVTLVSTSPTKQIPRRGQSIMGGPCKAQPPAQCGAAAATSTLI